MGPLAPYPLNRLGCGSHFTFLIDTNGTTTITILVGSDHHNINTGDCDIIIIITPLAHKLITTVRLTGDIHVRVVPFVPLVPLCIGSTGDAQQMWLVLYPHLGLTLLRMFHQDRLAGECDQISPLQSWGPELRYFSRLPRRPIVEKDCDVVIEKPTFILKIDASKYNKLLVQNKREKKVKKRKSEVFLFLEIEMSPCSLLPPLFFLLSELSGLPTTPLRSELFGSPISPNPPSDNLPISHLPPYSSSQFPLPIYMSQPAHVQTNYCCSKGGQEIKLLGTRRPQC
uniref:Uncharacterized protein n=1 Tax=Timema poppense TaxID=170557 RepID=A0A7R9H034_TIMPO|nr:unnamed protein product [Timema poppensis]